MGDHGREGLRRGGAAFFLRSGDGTVAVRCDPQDSMKSCVDATLTLMDRARSMQPSGAAPGGPPGGSLLPDEGLTVELRLQAGSGRLACVFRQPSR